MTFSRFLTFSTLSEWITQERIVEYIYVENPHSELIRRSAELIYLRSINKTDPFPQSLVDEIWKCCSEKHEDIVRASLSMLEGIAGFLDIDVLGKFYSHIKLLPDEEYDEMRVNFLKKYTEGSLNCLRKSRDQMIKDQNERFK